MKSISFKLIFRSWWRNKAFAVISVLSLAVGIACTNLLAAFVIHEYNVEAGNPNRERIYCIVQDSPFQEVGKVFYSSKGITTTIKDRYPEVEDYLTLNTVGAYQIIVGETIYDPITIMSAEASLPRFFPYRTLVGNPEEALTEPNKIALTEVTASRFFGKDDPIGQSITIYHSPQGGTTYQVVAIIQGHDQSYLSFDAITSLKGDHYGGPSFLMMNRSIDPEAFALRLKEDAVPTFMVDKGRYYLNTLQENFFSDDYKVQGLSHIRKQNKLTLDIGLLSALLILLIACFNYINLNFSRLLQQVKMIHVQKLMGASRLDINKQLFFDIFFTVLIGFMISLLVMYDLIPVFNSILSARMNGSFIFSGQVLPFLVGLILVLSVIPAIYVSRKITSLSRRHIVELSGGKKKQSIISVLSVIQLTISIALIIATLTVNSQVGLIRRGGDGYRDILEVGVWNGDGKNLNTFVTELRSHPELGEISTSEFSMFHYGIRQRSIINPDGSERKFQIVELGGNSGYLSGFRIKVKQGLQPEEALEHFARPVYINQRFADVFVGDGENPVGKSLKSYDEEFDYQKKEDGSKENPITTIAGVVDNFFLASLEEEVSPTIVHIRKEADMDHTSGNVYFRLDKKHPERLATVKQIWEKHHSGILFTYRNVYEDFLALNRKAFGLADLLLMYSLISIFLTCFGLFGMALYSTEQRTKEIGIRKVNGATIWQIVKLLNRRFILWITIAFLIAVPVTWILLKRWLQSFVYRADITIGVFIVALLTVTVIALLTVSWHSYRAATGNPVDALRDE
ncbi:putative ABC transport system permease protein [Parabacteroides sp. PF5-5]|uniref:ABC transporter permease n=1 Tax=unclassified Parabacteroides TaxID=2649774 RepID=UPI0024733FB4|nr:MULTISPECIES: FtsX-like permease family protein [unclassified Parabacteroides]MDH6304544.1 putative ABC transport system permease protein [Parabacteroides sp. PH5-39]MDH6315304.1 putative ABC transport system permease protein [Parabacteroides sp. PF5-13]MDH6319202.1 putative ABC transport system permease protein [Parabacteroides sp. PH5-13]MDH6322933.1 putative ABC transport system permease protein [Parabacteroides sp. PH5-8]MDH6326495.1 putative ABC transport system permease protein [Parab